MKKLLFIFAISLILTSCAPTIYYQMYQTKPTSENIKIYENKIVYEDDNCTILYDFWGEFGDIGFMIYNKSSENLYLHLDKCFYINNGYASDYYKNRIYNLNDFYVESKTVCIPSRTIKKITEYTISTELYRSCDLNYYNLLKVNNSLSFNKNDSPYVFSNRLVYSLGDSEELHHITNEFYVSKITNYYSEDIIKYVNTMDCATKGTSPIAVFKESGPDLFYIKYEFNQQTHSIKVLE